MTLRPDEALYLVSRDAREARDRSRGYEVPK